MPTSPRLPNSALRLLFLTAILSINPLGAQSPREVKPIVVVGAKSATTVGGASAVVVTADSLAVPAAAPLERLLREVPFVLVRQNSRGESEISVRGSDSRQAAVMLDGLPLTLGWDHRTDPSLVPTTGISEVTVVRGLSSVLGGPNALGGTVTFGLASRVSRASARLATSIDGVGAFGLSSSGSLPVATRFGALTLRGGLGVRDRSGIALARDGAAGAGITGSVPDPGQDGKGRLRSNSDLTQQDGFVAIRLDGANGRFTSVTATGSDGSRGVPGELHVTEPRRWRYPTVRRGVAIMSAGTGEVSTPFGRGRLEGSVGTNRGDVEIESFADATFGTVVGRELGAERTNTVRLLGKHSVGGRAELLAALTRTAIEYDETLGDGPTSQYRQELRSLGAEINWPLSLRTQLSAGIVHDGAETPRSGGKPTLGRLTKTGWRFGFSQLGIGDAVRFHGSISERSRFPALRELYSGALDRFVPNPSLRPEALLGLELGATLIGGAANAGAMLQAVVFHHQLEDAVVRVARPDRRFERVNRDEIRSTGLELLVGWTALPASRGGLPVGTRLSADLTLQRIRVYDRLLATSLPNVRRAEHNPEVRASLDLNLPLSSQWQGNAAVHVTGAQYCVHQDLDRQVRLGAQQVGDLGLHRDFAGRGVFRAMRAVLAVENVTDATVFDQCGLPQAGRTVRVGVELR
jgi:iron complex outermembrane receptor protein